MITLKGNNKSAIFFKFLAIFGPPIVMLISGVVLLFGWIYRISWVQNMGGNFPAMVPSTALSLYILGYLTIKLKITYPDREFISDTLLISVVLVISMINLLMTVMGAYMGIDGLFLIELRHDGTQEMALATSVCLLLASICILTIYFKSINHKLVKITSCLGFFLSISGLLNYIYSVDWFLVKSFYQSMAIHTALSFLLLFSSLRWLYLAVNNDNGVSRDIK